jgi:hypothetical protein
MQREIETKKLTRAERCLGKIINVTWISHVYVTFFIVWVLEVGAGAILVGCYPKLLQWDELRKRDRTFYHVGQSYDPIPSRVQSAVLWGGLKPCVSSVKLTKLICLVSKQPQPLKLFNSVCMWLWLHCLLNTPYSNLLVIIILTILGNDQLDALFLNVFIYASTCFEQQVLIIRRTKLY